MSQTTSGLRSMLSSPVVYETLQRSLGSGHYRRVVVDEHLRVPDNGRVLDIGCGPGDLVTLLPASASYVGFDLSESYIESARRRHGNRGEFFVGSIDDVAERVATLPRFDRMVATGVLHHVDDDTGRRLWQLAAKLLDPAGRAVTIDPCFHENQHPVARWLASRDRGQAVRTPDAYGDLARQAFDHVQVSVHTDLLRVPYSHAVVIAELAGAGID